MLATCPEPLPFLEMTTKLIKGTKAQAGKDYALQIRQEKTEWIQSGDTSTRVLCTKNDDEPIGVVFIGNITGTYFKDEVSSNFVLASIDEEDVGKNLKEIAKSVKSFCDSPVKDPIANALKIKIKSIDEIRFASHFKKIDHENLNDNPKRDEIISRDLTVGTTVAVTANIRTYDVKEKNSGIFFDGYSIFVLDQPKRIDESRPKKRIRFTQ